MGIRLRGFDYKKPYFYMVTLRRVKDGAAFSRLVELAEGQPDAAGLCDTRTMTAAKELFMGRNVGDNSLWLEDTPLTRAFAEVILDFHKTWYCIAPIDCFVIMPDHIHLIIRLLPVEKRVGLPTLVWQLTRRLEAAYFAIVAPDQPGGAGLGDTRTRTAAIGGGAGLGDTRTRTVAKSGEVSACGAGGDSARPHCFEREWHDWIVMKDGQLAAFTRYIRENGFRAWLRRNHREYFGRVRRVNFLGREWFCYGNAAILDAPVLEAFKGHRTTVEGSDEWNAMIERASRIGPGGAGVSTFMSPLEKAIGRAIGQAGGRWVVLSPEGFHERWHPTREYERFCAEGRMVFISLYEAMSRQPTKSELYARCHEMIDLAVEKLR